MLAAFLNLVAERAFWGEARARVHFYLEILTALLAGGRVGMQKASAVSATETAVKLVLCKGDPSPLTPPFLVGP